MRERENREDEYIYIAMRLFTEQELLSSLMYSFYAVIMAAELFLDKEKDRVDVGRMVEYGGRK